jgi:hypothetical protein
VLDANVLVRLVARVEERPVQRGFQLPGNHRRYLQRRLPAEKSTGLVQS